MECFGGVMLAKVSSHPAGGRPGSGSWQMTVFVIILIAQDMPFSGTAVSPRQNAQKRFPAVPADIFGEIKNFKLLGFLNSKRFLVRFLAKR